MLLNESTTVYIYPKKQIAEDTYSNFGTTFLPTFSLNKQYNNRYDIKQINLSTFMFKLSRHFLTYADFHISTTYDTLYNHITYEEEKEYIKQQVLNQIDQLNELEATKLCKYLINAEWSITRVIYPNYYIPKNPRQNPCCEITSGMPLDKSELSIEQPQKFDQLKGVFK